MKIKYKKSWNPWRQVKDAEEIIKFWQDYINTMHEELERYEAALERINLMKPNNGRNPTAQRMATVALDALMPEVKAK